MWVVHYLTALTACQIIANNAFDGYLAEQADGPRLAPVNNDSILTRTNTSSLSLADPPRSSFRHFKSGNFQGVGAYLEHGAMLCRLLGAVMSSTAGGAW